jgi:hypothetical protein
MGEQKSEEVRMRSIALPAAFVATLAAAPAHAELPPAHELYSRAETFVRSLIGQSKPDWEVIAPPADIDAGMVVVPPRSGNAMPIVPPPYYGR